MMGFQRLVNYGHHNNKLNSHSTLSNEAYANQTRLKVTKTTTTS